MASAFDWIKLTLENSKVIFPILVLLMSTTGYTAFSNIEKDNEIKASQDQIVNIANHLTKPVKNIKTVSCGSCKDLLKEHKKEHH